MDARTALLGTLSSRPGWGLDLIERVGELTGGEIVLGQGTIYPMLRDLESEGVLESYDGETVPERDGPRRYYRLSEEGTRVAERELNAFIVEACAEAAHQANKAYCEALGDGSQHSWIHAPDWQRKSARDGVRNVMRGLTPEQLHAAWWADKIADGWMYGMVKDPVKKTHPCMVPYSQLPAFQMAKDHLFVGVVRAMLQAFAFSWGGLHGGLRPPG